MSSLTFMMDRPVTAESEISSCFTGIYDEYVIITVVYFFCRCQSKGIMPLNREYMGNEI
jgi:hypothetical protein